MKKFFSFALLLSVPAWAGAVEHPEHPMSHENSAPAQPTAEEQAKAAHEAMIKSYSDTVEGYVDAQSAKTGGLFVVHDDKLNKDWRLSLIGIHKKRIVQLGEDTFFACADFKEKEGFMKSTKIDLDFYVKKREGGWTVDQVLIHKVNGQPRYTYNNKNERVPVP